MQFLCNLMVADKSPHNVEPNTLGFLKEIVINILGRDLKFSTSYKTYLQWRNKKCLGSLCIWQKECGFAQTSAIVDIIGSKHKPSLWCSFPKYKKYLDLNCKTTISLSKGGCGAKRIDLDTNCAVKSLRTALTLSPRVLLKMWLSTNGKHQVLLKSAHRINL